MKTINFGIDLGTTNSLIAKYTANGVEVFKNPVGFKETLPSCVAFRGDRIIIGDKAKEWLLKDPLHVFSGFKRKMGTSDTYYLPQKNTTLSPIQLSALVLSELKNFIYSKEELENAVITIPASFDTVQSNATKKAGYEAGFKEVVLLQEPIAASLAFFNKQTEKDADGKWLVYDLGGGTFDIALIGIDNNEMRVLDHQGDNYLGGLDFDHNLVMKVILPKLIEEVKLTDLTSELNSRNGKYEKLYYILLLKAEEAKKELTNVEKTEVEFSYDFDNGLGEKDYLIPITQQDLNNCIKESIDSTLEMIKSVVYRNNLQFSDLQQIIMIGGSTYIPYVRTKVKEVTRLVVNTSIDPTTAVAIGAAYFAGNKPVSNTSKAERLAQDTTESAIDIQAAYNKTTRDEEEYVSVQLQNCPKEGYYRITRSDGGFDTGLKTLSAKFGEFLTVRKNSLNEFTLRILDKQQKELSSIVPSIQITHGLFNVFGQPLPEDIAIEIDDIENNTTRCQLLFERNSILPVVKTIYKEVSKTINKNSDEHLIINVLEGNSDAHPSTNKTIGVIDISANQLMGDLIKGSDVEIRVEITESRDVSVHVNLLLFDQKFNDVFSPSEKHVSLSKLRDEIKEIKNILIVKIAQAEDAEDYERAEYLHTRSQKLSELLEKLLALKESDLSDLKYQIDDQKRKLAQDIYGGEVNTKLVEIKTEYYNWRNAILQWIETYDDIPKNLIEESEAMREREQKAFASNSVYQMEGLYKAASKLGNKIILGSPGVMTRVFVHYAEKDESEYTDYNAAKAAIARGEKALATKNYDELKSVMLQLYSLANNLVHQHKISGTGLG